MSARGSILPSMGRRATPGELFPPLGGIPSRGKEAPYRGGREASPPNPPRRGRGGRRTSPPAPSPERRGGKEELRRGLDDVGGTTRVGDPVPLPPSPSPYEGEGVKTIFGNGE